MRKKKLRFLSIPRKMLESMKMRGQCCFRNKKNIARVSKQSR